MGECIDEYPLFLSPVASFANRLLNADLSSNSSTNKKNEDNNNNNNSKLTGLLVRTADYFGLNQQSIGDVIRMHHNTPPDPIPPIAHLPASYLHASIRAPGSIYQNVMEKEGGQGDYTLLYGTQFGPNTALSEFRTYTDKTLDCAYTYLHDAGTIDRGTIFDKTMCNDAANEQEMCVDGECVANGPGSCNGCKVEPDKFGELVGKWAEANHLLDAFYIQSCFYDTIQEAVTASNSLWSYRKQWYTDTEFSGKTYQGYNECATSLHIDEPDMADAIVLTLHRSPTESSSHQSVCTFPNHVWLAQRLQLATEKGHGDLPVLFYRESAGIHRIEDCIQHFGGRDCHDAWQKEFFSQEYQFGGDGCLHKPPNCDEVYYFPGDDEECSAFTDAGKERMERLCREEKNHNARRAYDKLFSTNQGGAEEPDDAQINVPPIPAILNSTLVVEADAINESPTKVSSTILVQDTSTPGYITNASFFLVGMVVSLFIRKRLRVTSGAPRAGEALYIVIED